MWSSTLQINWKQRFFVPTEEEPGIAILAALLEQFPAIDFEGEEADTYEPEVVLSAGRKTFAGRRTSFRRNMQVFVGRNIKKFMCTLRTRHPNPTARANQKQTCRDSNDPDGSRDERSVTWFSPHALRNRTKVERRPHLHVPGRRGCRQLTRAFLGA